MGFWGGPKEKPDTSGVELTEPTGMDYPGFIAPGYVRPVAPHMTDVDQYDVENNIDRGDYDHGVVSHAKQVKDQIDQTTTSDAVDVVVPESNQIAKTKPIPVTSRLRYEQERRKFRATQSTVGTVPARIAGQFDQRDQILIQNNGTVTIYIGDDNQVDSNTGFPLVAGATLTLRTQEAVYAVAASTALVVQPVGMVEEYVVQEDAVNG